MKSDQIAEVIKEVRSFYQAHGNPELVKKYSRFFVEGYDAYGVDQKVIESQRLIWFDRFETNLVLMNSYNWVIYLWQAANMKKYFWGSGS